MCTKGTCSGTSCTGRCTRTDRATTHTYLRLLVVILIFCFILLLATACASDQVTVDDWHLRMYNCKIGAKRDAWIRGADERYEAIECKWRVSALGE